MDTLHYKYKKKENLYIKDRTDRKGGTNQGVFLKKPLLRRRGGNDPEPGQIYIFIDIEAIFGVEKEQKEETLELLRNCDFGNEESFAKDGKQHVFCQKRLRIKKIMLMFYYYIKLKEIYNLCDIRDILYLFPHRGILDNLSYRDFIKHLLPHLDIMIRESRHVLNNYREQEEEEEIKVRIMSRSLNNIDLLAFYRQHGFEKYERIMSGNDWNTLINLDGWDRYVFIDKWNENNYPRVDYLENIVLLQHNINIYNELNDVYTIYRDRLLVSFKSKKRSNYLKLYTITNYTGIKDNPIANANNHQILSVPGRIDAVNPGAFPRGCIISGPNKVNQESPVDFLDLYQENDKLLHVSSITKNLPIHNPTQYVEDILQQITFSFLGDVIHNIPGFMLN